MLHQKFYAWNFRTGAALNFNVESTQEYDLTRILRILAKKGVYEIFLYIRDHDGQRYNRIQSYALEKRLTESRASINTAITELTDLGLLKREIIQDRPVQTCYSISHTGHKIIKHLKEIEDIINE